MRYVASSASDRFVSPALNPNPQATNCDGLRYPDRQTQATEIDRLRYRPVRSNATA
jgi:hypothetical protein